ncbi:hypothetical protein ES708_24325 [subsurface metagenome]
MESVITEYGKEYCTSQRSTGTHGNNDLFECSTPGNPGNKQTHVRSIGNPPGPVEDSPPLRETALADGIHIEAHLDEIVEHESQAVGESLDDEPGRPEHKNQGAEYTGYPEVDIAQHFYTFTQSQGSRSGKNCRPDTYNGNIDPKGVLYTEEFAYRFGEHRCSQAQRGARSADKAEDKEHIDDLSPWAFCRLVTDNPGTGVA